MAGMEQLQVHARSYIVRWVNVKDEHVISWSIQPQKKGVNFGLYKHPGSGIAPTPQLPSSTFQAGGSPEHENPPDLDAKDDHQSQARGKLKGLGYKQIRWHGFCEAGQVVTGTHQVGPGEGGMYALVLDNTFAKSYSKTINLALITYPSNAGVGAVPFMTHLGVFDAKFGRPGATRRASGVPMSSVDLRSAANGDDGQDQVDESKVFAGVLQKRRRKKGQGYARRFFSLDLESSTLAYYHDRNSTTIRGIIPLTLAAIGANEKSREISVDSGAEVWHLKAGNARDFTAWHDALEKASIHGKDKSPTPRKPAPLARVLSNMQPHINESLDLLRAEDITKRIEQARNLARSVAKDTDPKYFSPNESPSISRNGSDLAKWDSGSEVSGSDATTHVEAPAGQERKSSSWWRKDKGKVAPPNKRSTSATSEVPSVNSLSVSAEDLRKPPKTQQQRASELEGVHEQCMALLRNLDSIVTDMQALVSDSKAKQVHAQPQLMPLREAGSRLSMESSFSQEFFDAEAGDLLTIHNDDDRPQSAGRDTMLDRGGEDSASDIDEDEGLDTSQLSGDQARAIFPSKPRNLHHMANFAALVRRSAVPAPKVMPPSLIGFLRKNVGKDLSTVSMPVSANEPLSMTQKAAEIMEYSELLDSAADPDLGKPERLLLVAAFAISGLSAMRVKERSIRKPFNPMLGETFELVREDKGYRFVAEKVCHRPVILACQADSERWSLAQSPAPTQKFWGKSAELITEGRVRLTMHTTGEQFTWSAPTCMLRNLIAGEKYVEPCGTMTVKNETTGQQVVVTFKVKGMFSGRSEECDAQAYDNYGDELPNGLTGKWTSSLTLTVNGEAKAKPIWTAGELSTDASKGYGFTAFAASLNEISPRDKPHIPPTDSRLRPDQRALEENDVDAAEDLKAKLEEAQRARRKEYESEGKEWTPQWFHKVASIEGEDIWGIRRGKDNYWEHRAKGDWKGVVPVLEM